MKKIASFLLCVFFFHLISPASLSQNRKIADLAIINARIRTMDKSNPSAEAVAVKGNKIIAVGTNSQIKRLLDQNTQTIDARGKLLLPGFNDAHVHFAGIGNLFSSLDLREAKSAAEIAEKIKYYVQFLPKSRWILGSGWNQENFDSKTFPTKETIDAITPDNPVFLYHSNGQTALANSLALKLAGIEKSKNYPADTVLRDEKGELTGILKNSAINPVKNIVPKNYTQNWMEVAEIATNYAASLGITSVQDVHSDDLTTVYKELRQQEKLKTRIYDCYYLPAWERLARANIKRADGDAMIRGGCLKFFSEGDYEEIPQLYEMISAADKADLQVMMHAIGGAANDIVLTIYERILKENGAKDRRFRIEHAYNFRPPDLRRFANSKIIPSLQPHLFDGNEPYRMFLNSGANLAFGSDASITDFNPLLGIHAAVNTSNQLNGVKQSMTVNEAVYAYTAGSAYAEFQENIKGTVSVGKLADLVMLTDDIFVIPAAQIKNSKVLTTIVDGKIVFERK